MSNKKTPVIPLHGDAMSNQEKDDNMATIVAQCYAQLHNLHPSRRLAALRAVSIMLGVEVEAKLVSDLPPDDDGED